MSRKSKNKQKKIKQYSQGTPPKDAEETQFFMFLKRNWDTENFRKMQERERKYREAQQARGADRGAGSRERWKNDRGSWRNDERERREREQLQDDYFSGSY